MLAGIIKFEPTAVVLQLRRGLWAGQACHNFRLYGQHGQELSVENLSDMTARDGQSLLEQLAEPLAQGVDICVQNGWTGSLVSFFSAVTQARHGSSDLTGLLETRKLCQAVVRSATSRREVSIRA